MTWIEVGGARNIARGPHPATALPSARASGLLLALMFSLPLAAQTNNCEAIQADIGGRLQAKGLNGYRLFNVEAAASAPGRVVGQCDKSARKIMLVLGTGVASAGPKEPAPPANDGIPTECKDGTVVIGPDCSAGKRRAASR